MLISKIDECFWRLLYNYYPISKSVVNIWGINSEIFQTKEGVKQGEVLSPFLFNFFLNDLIESNCDLNIGAKIARINICTLAYCDDLILLSPMEEHMKRLLKSCESYATGK